MPKPVKSREWLVVCCQVLSTLLRRNTLPGSKPPPPALRALPPAVGLDQRWTMADGDNWVFDSLVNFLRGPIWNVPILTLIENKSLGRLSQLWTHENDLLLLTVFEPEGEKEHEAEYKKIHEDYKNLVDIPPTHQLDKSRTLMYIDTSIYSCSLVTWIWKTANSEPWYFC